MAYYWRGLAYKEMGKKGEAISDFERVVSLGGKWADRAEEELERLQESEE